MLPEERAVLGACWRWAVFDWDEQLEEVNQQIAELEDRISAFKKGLEVTQSAADAARAERVIAFREQQLDRLNFWSGFIQEKIALGHREVKPIPYIRNLR
jgi:hypothetical protein